MGNRFRYLMHDDQNKISLEPFWCWNLARDVYIIDMETMIVYTGKLGEGTDMLRMELMDYFGVP